jgi:hypothetical protein
MEGFPMLRRVLVLASAAALALALTSPAMAARPTREYLPLPDTIDLAAGEGCAFPVRIDILVNREYGVTFGDASGNLTRQLVSGALIIGLTNVDNGQSITVDISGPAEFVVHADGSSTFTLRGNSMPIAPGGLFRTTGTVVQEFDPDGNLLSTSPATGRQIDLCAALA